MKKSIAIILAVIFTLSSMTIASASNTIKYQNGAIIEFGSYPQSEVKDEAVLNQLSSMNIEWKEYKYNNPDGTTYYKNWGSYADIDIDGDGIYDYRANRSRDCQGNHNSVDALKNKKIRNNSLTICYFKYEPLLWRVVDSEKGYLVCNNQIDCSAYQYKLYSDGSDGYNSEDYTHYASDWETSSVRRWLNETFYEVAFNDSEKNIISISHLENPNGTPAWGGGMDQFEKYNGADTDDKIFIPSINEIGSGSYSIKSEIYSIKTSDYAQCEGCAVSHQILTGTGYNDYFDNYSWLLRSGIMSDWVAVVDTSNVLEESPANRRLGIVPALKIDDLNERSFNVHKHSFSVCEIPGTCTNRNGCFDYCDRCKLGKNFNFFEYKSHDFGDWTIKTNPTFEKDGTMERKCSVCNNVEVKVIPKLEVEEYLPTIKENAPLHVDEEKAFISGFDRSKSVEELLAETFELKENTYIRRALTGKAVTGDYIEIRYNGSENILVKQYQFIVYGDVDGDGEYNGMDATIVSLMMDGAFLFLFDESYEAADCNHDGKIDQLDVDILNQAGVLLSKVDQTKTAEELQTDSAYLEYVSFISQKPINTDEKVKPDKEETNKEEGIFAAIFNAIWSFIESFIGFLIMK